MGPPVTPYDPTAKIPGLAMAAAIIWIAWGGLGLVGNLAALGDGGGVPRLILPVAFLVTGIQALLGKTSSILGAGIACVVLAGLGLIAILALPVMLGGRAGFAGIWLLVGLTAVTPLLVSGILAIKSNAAYKRWVAVRRTRPIS
jgi:hypothetical protein